MRYLYVVFRASLLAGSSGLLSVACADEPSPGELIAQATTVSSADGKSQRIYVAGQAKMDGFLDIDFSAQYRSPDQYSMCVRNRLDSTPLIYQVNTKAFIYDIVGESLLYISNACFDCKLYVGTDKLRLSLGAWKSDDACNILIDVKSFYGKKAARSEVARIDSGNIRLTQTHASGISVVGLIDASRRCKFKKLDLIEAGSRQPYIKISELAVDEDVVAALPVFPSFGRLVGKVTIRDLSNDDVFGKSAAAAVVRRIYLGFVAATNRDLREQYESQFSVRIDWDRVETSYRRTAPTIRDMINVGTGADNTLR